MWFSRDYLFVWAIAVHLFSNPAWSAEPQKFYYLGEAKLAAADGRSIGSQVILFEKTHDPDKSSITERALVVQADGKVEEHTMRVTVKPRVGKYENSFTLVDDAKSIEGTGTLFGPEWKWTYFKANYKATNGVQIEDENFMADDSVITARKKVTGPDGQVFMFMEMSLKGITPKTFEILRAGMIKREPQSK